MKHRAGSTCPESRQGTTSWMKEGKPVRGFRQGWGWGREGGSVVAEEMRRDAEEVVGDTAGSRQGQPGARSSRWDKDELAWFASTKRKKERGRGDAEDIRWWRWWCCVYKCVWGVWAKGCIGNEVLEKDPKRNSKKGTCSLTKGCLKCYLKIEFKVPERKVSKVKETWEFN